MTGNHETATAEFFDKGARMNFVIPFGTDIHQCFESAEKAYRDALEDLKKRLNG
jgi:hypothetical protein